MHDQIGACAPRDNLNKPVNRPATSAIIALPPQSPNLAKGIFMRYMAFGECARTSPEQPRGDQDCQYDRGKLGHLPASTPSINESTRPPLLLLASKI
jgi:hypothetical protein